MLDRLRKLFASKSIEEPQDWALPEPERPIAVIGDVHGCDRVLRNLLDRLDPRFQRVFVGDLVDRGEDSAAVVRRVRALDDSVCLRGNHEQMLLDFLADPEANGARWLRNGGLQTLASYGVARLTVATKGQQLTMAAETLRTAMGDTLDWIEARPLMHLTGNVAIVHAGADPACRLDAQQAAHLVWGHPKFKRTERPDGIWIAHGHTIVETPTAEAGRIACDTGAYATGRLTAAILGDGPVRFETVTR